MVGQHGDHGVGQHRHHHAEDDQQRERQGAADTGESVNQHRQDHRVQRTQRGGAQHGPRGESDVHARHLGGGGTVPVRVDHRVAQVQERGLQIRHGRVDTRRSGHRRPLRAHLRGLHLRAVAGRLGLAGVLPDGQAGKGGLVLGGQRLVQIRAVVDARTHEDLPRQGRRGRHRVIVLLFIGHDCPQTPLLACFSSLSSSLQTTISVPQHAK